MDMVNAGVRDMHYGDRVYYTGDMANVDGYGRIVAMHDADRWSGRSVDVKADDGRQWNGLTDLNFADGPGRRFYLAEEWEAKKRSQFIETLDGLNATPKQKAKALAGYDAEEDV